MGAAAPVQARSVARCRIRNDFLLPCTLFVEWAGAGPVVAAPRVPRGQSLPPPSGSGVDTAVAEHGELWKSAKHLLSGQAAYRRLSEAGARVRRGPDSHEVRARMGPGDAAFATSWLPGTGAGVRL